MLHIFYLNIFQYEYSFVSYSYNFLIRIYSDIHSYNFLYEYIWVFFGHQIWPFFGGMGGDRYDDNDDVFDANSTNETFILSDGPTPDQAG